MATISTQNPGTAGATPTSNSAAGGGDKVSPGTRLLIVNGGAGTMTATIATPLTVDSLTLQDREIVIPNGSFPANSKFVDVPSALYQQPSDGLCNISWSSTTSVTFYVVGAQPS